MEFAFAFPPALISAALEERNLVGVAIMMPSTVPLEVKTFVKSCEGVSPILHLTFHLRTMIDPQYLQYLRNSPPLLPIAVHDIVYIVSFLLLALPDMPEFVSLFVLYP
ncbi:hypothetical protein DEO72_LG1g3229 [Vigna unguiculata]|uniref:Uncharacterized protein n=1 Tax=Vigna unguiculata TaxID=3917 RepID=A0A4D6KZI6_VIGUN|nr:hypothetical protein DEO72_LG1g3229 [Vigna unguiculata]